MISWSTVQPVSEYLWDAKLTYIQLIIELLDYLENSLIQLQSSLIQQ